MGDSPATRTGSFPGVTAERPQPPPTPPHGTPEWFAWATRVLEGIGRPPIPAIDDPGAGMWMVLAAVRADCTAILQKLDAADEASATWAARLARFAWKVVETAIPMGIGGLLYWLSQHWR